MKSHEIPTEQQTVSAETLVSDSQYIHALRLLTADIRTHDFRNAWRTYVLTVYGATGAIRPSANNLNARFNAGIEQAKAEYPQLMNEGLVSPVNFTGRQWNKCLNHDIYDELHDIYGRLNVLSSFPEIADGDYAPLVEAIDSGTVTYRVEQQV